MVGSRFYDWMYTRGAPWEIGPRSELVELVTSGRLSPQQLPRAIDLGCGTGANPVFLAEHGFDVVGIDFSPVALEKSRARAVEAGVADRCRFEQADLTADLSGLGTFDLVVDYGTLDDLRGERRAAMAANVARLTGPGSQFLLWCFYGSRRELPVMSFSGPSKLVPGLVPGEVERRFGDVFASIERLPEPPEGSHFACFLLSR